MDLETNVGDDSIWLEYFSRRIRALELGQHLLPTDPNLEARDRSTVGNTIGRSAWNSKQRYAYTDE